MMLPCPCRTQRGYWTRADIERLTKADEQYCRQIGRARDEYKKKGVKDGIFDKSPEQALRVDVMGACAEGAVLRFLGLPLRLTVNDHGIVDIPATPVPGSIPLPECNGIQVKARFKDHAETYQNMLIPHKSILRAGYEDTIFLCVHETAFMTFAIMGFIWGHEITLFGRCDPNGYDKKAKREPAFDIPVSQMHRLPFTSKHMIGAVSSKVPTP